MKSIKLSHPTAKLEGRVEVPGSKSESNRLLVLKHLYFPDLKIDRISNSRDTLIMQSALQSCDEVIDIGDAGTAMRFLTAYYASLPGKATYIQGSRRMHQRPIGILVDALSRLGATISYGHNVGYPPLRIEGQKLQGGQLVVDSSVSSQFISALMMIAPAMEQGLQIQLINSVVSAPYIHLTATIMRSLGLEVRLTDSTIEIPKTKTLEAQNQVVEPDWSAASYWYAMAALSAHFMVQLPGFRKKSQQGDAAIAQLFEPLGVSSAFIDGGLRLQKSDAKNEIPEIDLLNTPDLAQTMAVVCAAKNQLVKITGLQTLRIKETDRLQALKTELEKTGAEIEIGEDFLEIKKGVQFTQGVTFETYDDHRMAMALAPLALLSPIIINNPQVVAKSYPTFWEDLEGVGFTKSEIVLS